MQDFETIAYLVAAVALMFAMFALLRWRRATRIMSTRVLIGEAMTRRGITPADAEAAGLESEVMVAQGRCTDCRTEIACRVWLADAGPGQLPESCPNKQFFEEVASRKGKNYKNKRIEML